MNVEEEVAEFRPHVTRLDVDGPNISITTLEGIEIRAELTPTGLHISECSVDTDRMSYDDLT